MPERWNESVSRRNTIRRTPWFLALASPLAWGVGLAGESALGTTKPINNVVKNPSLEDPDPKNADRPLGFAPGVAGTICDVFGPYEVHAYRWQ